MSIVLHAEAPAILSRFKKEGINAFYHFTSVDNLPMILQAGGLLSKECLESRGMWPPPKPGGNPLSHSLDRQYGNWSFVSLNFTPHTPMVYHKKREDHLCFIVVKPEVGLWETTIFCETNAAKRDHQWGRGVAGLNEIDFRQIRAVPAPNDSVWKRKVQAEVLVSDMISVDYFSDFAFVSEASLEHSQRLCGLLRPHPKFVVKPELFSDARAADTVDMPHVDMPHVNTIAMVNYLITNENIDSGHVHMPRIQKASSEFITCVADIQASTGSSVCVYWTSINKISRLEIATRGSYMSVVSQPTAHFQRGQHRLEYFIDDILWASTEFQLV